jgi:hypothetical protein
MQINDKDAGAYLKVVSRRLGDPCGHQVDLDQLGENRAW